MFLTEQLLCAILYGFAAGEQSDFGMRKFIVRETFAPEESIRNTLRKKKEVDMRVRDWKKQTVTMTMSVMLAVSAFGMAGCGKDASGTETDGSQIEENTETEEETTVSVEVVGANAEELLTARNLNLDDYVTMGDYEGIEISDLTYEIYTAEAFETDLQSYLNYCGEYDLEEVTDHDTAELGDTLAIDYVGTMDGEEFSGGTGSSDLTLGSGSFIDGFEDGLVGCKTGDVVDLNLTFPEDYSSESLAGQDVVFTVTVNGIYTKTMHEFTDELASSLFGYDTVEECKIGIVNSTNESNIEEAEENQQMELIEKLLSNFTISGYPEDLHQEYSDVYYNYYADYAGAYGYELEDFLSSAYGMTEDDLKSAAESYADSQCQYYLVLMSIAKAENIEITADEINSYVSETVTSNSITESDFWAQVTLQDIQENLLGNKVIDFVMENAVIIESEEETETETVEETETEVETEAESEVEEETEAESETAEQ